jgi:hypothetical protein
VASSTFFIVQIPQWKSYCQISPTSKPDADVAAQLGICHRDAGAARSLISIISRDNASELTGGAPPRFRLQALDRKTSGWLETVALQTAVSNLQKIKTKNPAA